MARHSRRSGFGDASTAGARYLNPRDQEASLKTLAELALRGSISPLVRTTALKIVRDCGSREDACELQAVYDAVKRGDPGVAPLRNGFKYVADSRFADYFTSPADSLSACLRGACGGDCDDHTALICALLGSLGWRCGLRAWGRRGEGVYSHVYAVALFPKRPPWTQVIGMDTTVPEFNAGDEPPRGDVMTAWLS